MICDIQNFLDSFFRFAILFLETKRKNNAHNEEMAQTLTSLPL